MQEQARRGKTAVPVACFMGTASLIRAVFHGKRPEVESLRGTDQFSEGLLASKREVAEDSRISRSSMQAANCSPVMDSLASRKSTT